MAFKPGNHTQIPNVLLDTMMAGMGEAELKVILAALRKTTGYHRDTAPISLTLFIAMTGLSRQGVLNGIGQAIAHGHLREAGTGARGVKLYEPVYLDDQSTELTSQASRPVLVNMVDQSGAPLVNTVDPLKKESLKKKRKKDSADASKQRDKDIAAMIAAWLKAQGAVQPRAFGNKVIRELAGALVDEGYTAEAVHDYVLDRKAEDFWATKFIKFEMVAAELVSWVEAQPPEVVEVAREPEVYVPSNPELAQKVIEANRLLAEMMGGGS